MTLKQLIKNIEMQNQLRKELKQSKCYMIIGCKLASTEPYYVITRIEELYSYLKYLLYSNKYIEKILNDEIEINEDKIMVRNLILKIEE